MRNKVFWQDTLKRKEHIFISHLNNRYKVISCQGKDYVCKKSKNSEK